MNLTELRPQEGANRSTKRIGRGRGSGHGKTSTRGHNGQGQRAGQTKRFGFEGGQTPLFRRLPKIHCFGWVPRRQWVAINVGSLNNLPPNTELNPENLAEFGLHSGATESLRILGNGELKVALKVHAHHFTQGAIDKIQQAGGSYEVIHPEPQKRGRIPVGGQ